MIYEDENPPCYEDPFYGCIHRNGEFITSNVFSTKTNFHGKYYSGSLQDHTEMVMTSFNMLTSEYNQYETFKFINLINVDFNTIRPDLNWQQFILNKDILKRECIEDFLVEKKIKSYFKSKGFRISRDLLPNDIINEKIQIILNKAIERAKRNNRNIVRPEDL